jgi:hypothetical protein
MFAAVQFLYLRGVRLKPGQHHPQGIIKAHVQTYSLKGTLIASLKQEPSLAQELALLYRVELSGIGSDRFRLIGLEKVVSGREVAWVNQCWVCRVDSSIGGHAKW